MGTISGKGKCICGAVELEAATIETGVGACHCKTCRTWGGGPLLAVDCKQSVTFSGDDNISVYNSSDWAERGFCRNCGTHLFYRLKHSGQHIVPVALFGVADEVELDHQIFVDEKPSYYDFANQTSMMTGAEVFAQYGGE